jgi:hypothetical protein
VARPLRCVALPGATAPLLELAELRLECLRVGVRDVTVQPVKVGVRSRPLVKISPLSMTFERSNARETALRR